MTQVPADASYRDLNKNGRLDSYEDPSQPIAARVEDLLAQMTLAEKAGLLFHAMAPMGSFARFMPSAEHMIATKDLKHFNVLGSASPREMAEWSNAVQRAAEESRLGIPVTISTDPRHAFSENVGANFAAGDFSQWPEPLGLAATRDAALVGRFGDIARQEYVAVGIRAALHPVADLATEPRWARINGTFGEDADLASDLVAAYIRGFQGSEIGPDSVSCMTKHFPGGGPQKDGEDPHFPYGREQIYPGDNWDYHLKPFEAAFAAGTAQLMPYYGMPIGTGHEEVGFGFSREIVTGLLREHYGYDGIVCTDWGLVHDANVAGLPLPARAWGVEHLTPLERVKKIIDAGCDQFGGESCPELIIELVETGQVSEERIDVSARRLLREKFRLGLFDNPYVDPEAAQSLVGSPAFQAAGLDAQRRSIVLLKNDGVLPLTGRPKVYVEGIDPAVLAGDAEVVADVDDADFAILRIAAPYEPRNEFFLEAMFHAGSLAFPEETLDRLLTITRSVPTIIDIYLDRPAVMPEVAATSAALVANFGTSPGALLDILFGRIAPTGKLPFELPSSMEAVAAQHPDVPYDSVNPLYPFGHGLTYGSGSRNHGHAC